MNKIKSRIERFKEWQEEPYPVAPLSNDNHVCQACETEYIGNFCPRCGQSHKIEDRMSLKKTFLLFIDVWGIGNRGMFHTIRDLILRPGFLICDYLRGKRSSYFPPFKLLFLLTTLSILVSAGFNIYQENYTRDYHVSLLDLQGDYENITTPIFQLWNYIIDLQEKFPALFRLALMVVTCGFYYMFFRKSKRIGNLNYHEFFIAMVYMVNMANIYSIIFRFFGGPDWLVSIPTLLYIIPLKQMSGFSWLTTIGKFLLTWLIIIINILILFFLIIFVSVSLYD